MLKSVLYLHHINFKKKTMSRIYTELSKAQDECYDAKMYDLFDLCQYHIDFMSQNELSKSNKLIISKFAKDVFKIAKLKNELDPLI